MKLSVIMPVYNEIGTIDIILKRVQNVPVEKEIILVDDGSTDGTRDYLSALDASNIVVHFHEENQGKGAAIRTALDFVSGEMVIIQDADLEYSPEEYPGLIKPIVEGRADVVYGSRFLGCHRVFMFYHFLGNKMLTWFTNLLYNTMLTDMETCYKVFRTEVIKNFTITCDRFNFEPEITAKIFKQRLRVYEMPISYDGRDYDEGKKITWLDAFPAMWALVKFKFSD